LKFEKKLSKLDFLGKNKFEVKQFLSLELLNYFELMEETDVLGATDATSLGSALLALMDPIDTNRFVELVTGHSQKTPSL